MKHFPLFISYGHEQGTSSVNVVIYVQKDLYSEGDCDGACDEYWFRD